MIEESGDQSLKYKKCENVRKEGWDIIVGSSLAYDKSIISLSTVALGFIFAVSKGNPVATGCKAFLVFILILLILTVVCSLSSFWFDQLFGYSLRHQAKLYYKNEGSEFAFRRDWSYYASLWSKILSGMLFTFSLILFTIYFCNDFLR